MSKPLTNNQIWGENYPVGKKEDWHCKNHPDREPFTDLGKDYSNRYPCRKCYYRIIGKEFPE